MMPRPDRRFVASVRPVSGWGGVDMIARLSTIQSGSEQVDTFLVQAKKARAAVLQMDGCKGYSIFVDRKTGKLRGLSLWESEEKLRASEAAMNQQRDQTAQKIKATSAVTEVYEVID
jgi:quinol monooxygenase YgiN